MTATTLVKNAEHSVGMAQVALVEPPQIARAVLGSCIGLVLHHSRRKVAVMCHIVLPEKNDRPGPPGKFADAAVPHMLELLQGAGAGTSGLIAKIAGGANMFGGNGPLQVGEANAAIVRQLLEERRIPLLGEHVGGNKGRRVTFDITTGELKIEIIGEPAVII